jgi:uncharacterized protein YggE
VKLIAGLLVLASILHASTAIAQPEFDAPHLAVSGHAEQQVIPDVFPLVIELSMTSDDIAAAQAEIEGLAKRVLEAAQALKVADDDITIGNLRIGHETEWNQESRKSVFVGNQYQRRFEIRLRTLDTLRALVAKLPANRHMKVQTQPFVYSGAAELRRKLRAQAVKDARAAAAELAAAVDRRLGEVQSVSDQPQGRNYAASYGINAIDVMSVETSNVLTSEMIVKQGVITISADAYLVYLLAK